MLELKIPNFDEYKIELKEPDRTFSMVMYSKEQVDSVIQKLLTEIAVLKSLLEKRKEDDIQKSIPASDFNPSTVKIGNTLWMTENLAYDDGEEGITYNPENKEYYYTWDAAKRVAKKLGWKVPSREDWDRACEECGCIQDDDADYYGKCSLKKKLDIKLADFNIIDFYNIGSYGYFWSSSYTSSSTAWYRNFYINNSSVAARNGSKSYCLSVRLIKEPN